MTGKMDIAFCPGMHTPEDSGKTLNLYHELGATSVQLYIDWKEVEKTPGVYDWSSYDHEVEKLCASDLKMGPFIIIGPWYVTPQFIRDEPGMVMYRCVEHDRDCAIPSLWYPEIRQHVRRFMGAFAEHFLPADILQFVILGITGDYGEGLYPIVGNGPGAYHGHPGHWCADPLAVADLQRWLRVHYNDSLQAVNQAWKTHYNTFDDVFPFIRRDAPSERAYLELIRWYRQSMTDYCDFWMQTTAECFPGLPAYLCTGGLMLPEHGADFSAQVRCASRTGGGVRVTNEYSDYCTNFMQTRLVNSAGRGYGAFSSHEPASIVTPAGVVGRIFNAVSSGCAQLFSYPGAYLDSPPAVNAGGEMFKHYQHLLQERVPVVPVGVFYPDADRVLRSAVSLDRFPLALRHLVDFDLVDENMIQDGLLDRYTYLVVADASVMQAGTLEKLNAWVDQGGVLININCMVADLEGSEDIWRKLNGFTPLTDRYYGITSQQILKPELLPRYAQAQPHFATACYGPLETDCLPLVGVTEGWYPPIVEYGRIAWSRSQAKGAVVSYFGLIDPKSGHAGWAAADQAALIFLTDLFEHVEELGLKTAAPTTLHPSDDGVFLSQFTDGLLVMNFSDQAVTTTINSKKVVLEANSIIEL